MVQKKLDTKFHIDRVVRPILLLENYCNKVIIKDFTIFRRLCELCDTNVENNCVKLIKIDTLSAVQIFGRDSSFWQYKVCVDIFVGSLERRH